jgi:hypothetical protein
VTIGVTARRVGLIVIVGLATGVLSQLAQDLLPGEWSQLGNAISPWLLVAFLLGSRMPDARWAVAAGVVALLTAVIGFYATTTIRFGIGGGTSSLIFWGVGALAGGTVFGLAGFTWGTSPVHRRRALALGLLAAVFIGEGLYHWQTLAEPTVAAAFAVIGLAIPAVLGRSRNDRLGGYVAIVPALALGALGFVTFLFLYGLLTGVG